MFSEQNFFQNGGQEKEVGLCSPGKTFLSCNLNHRMRSFVSHFLKEFKADVKISITKCPKLSWQASTWGYLCSCTRERRICTGECKKIEKSGLTQRRIDANVQIGWCSIWLRKIHFGNQGTTRNRTTTKWAETKWNTGARRWRFPDSVFQTFALLTLTVLLSCFPARSIVTPLRTYWNQNRSCLREILQ